MEENGSLAIGEKGCHDGQIPQVRPHPNFKLFLTMDPRDGELSPAMRNRYAAGQKILKSPGQKNSISRVFCLLYLHTYK